MKKITNKNNEEGQAVFEFIIFVPFFIFLVLIIYVIGNSINASINQQKITRAYFYFVTSHNSFAPAYQILKDSPLKYISQDSIGWKEKGDENRPIAECFPLPTFFGGKKNDNNCDVGPASNDRKVKMIRIYTVYGTCTATYTKQIRNKFHWMQKTLGTNSINCIKS